METIPETSTTLLKDIAHDSQHARWSEFVARYRPMMEAFMRERFPSLDPDDAIQETLIALVDVLPGYRYSPDEKGHFHNYLTGILRNKALRELRKERRQTEIIDGMRRLEDNAPSYGESPSQRLTARTGGSSVRMLTDFDPSWREAIFEIALHQFLADETVADRTKRIFERVALGGESPESVATAFKVTRHAVDQAKSRALARIRALTKKLEAVADA